MRVIRDMALETRLPSQPLHENDIRMPFVIPSGGRHCGNHLNFKTLGMIPGFAQAGNYVHFPCTLGFPAARQRPFPSFRREDVQGCAGHGFRANRSGLL